MKQTFHMIDVGAKEPTHRRAVAQGRIVLSKAAFDALKTNPKGDVLAIAEVSGILAAKNVPAILPLCHPLPIEQVLISFETDSVTCSVTAFCSVSVTAKTGAEMEALAGVNGALLCVYDLSKAVDPVLKISDIRLNEKHGGKSGVWTHPEFSPKTPAASSQKLEGVRAAVLTISDRASRGEVEDQSGPKLADALRAQGAEVVSTALVADDRSQIQAAFRRLALETNAQVVISTGGTGLSPRDVTPEALAEICERQIPGFGEALRADGAKHIASAYLSRSMAGTLKDKLLIALPGSPKAVVEGVETLTPLLKHSLHTLRGGDHAVR